MPLVTAHWAYTVGTYLVRAGSRHWVSSPWWTICEVAVVLGLQLALFLFLRLLRRVSTTRRVALLTVALVVLTPLLHGLLLVRLPIRFMIEASTAPARNLLTEVCLLRDVDLVPGLQSVFGQVEPAAFVVRNADQQPGLVTIPECRVAPLPIPAAADIASISSAGILWTSSRRTADPPREWLVTSFGGGTVRVDGSVLPANALPHLFDDGKTIGWIERGDPIRIAVANGSGVTRIPVASLTTGSIELFRGAGPSGPFHLSALEAGPVRWLTVDGAGQVRSSLDAPGVLSRFSHQVLPLPDGWIGWDTYVDDGRYRVAWSRGNQTGQRELARGLAVTSAAVDTRGEFVAMSATSGLNIGSQQDEVWLVRTADGGELFRRYAPKYSRATVALPGGRYFAVSEIAGTAPAVRVYALPGSH